MLIDLLRRRAFLLTGGFFLIYGVTAMGGSVTAKGAVEAHRLPEIRSDFLRVRGEDEALQPAGDPFNRRPLDGEGFDEVVPEPARLGPLVPSLAPSPLPDELLPHAIVPEPVVVVVPPEPDKDEDLFQWPEDFLLRLEATMSTSRVQSARINGQLLELGQTLDLAGESFLLERVEGLRAILVWRGHRIALDLLDSPSVGPGGMPIDR